MGAEPKLMEVTTGAQPSEVLALSASPRGLALGGTTLFVLTAPDETRSLLIAK
jgi:hypothetical protein